MQVAVLNKENKELKKLELPEAVFKAAARPQLLFDVVQMYLNNKRQGDGKAKFRWEVAGSTRKIYKQKGTGQARHGSIRANIFVGGGVSHPPQVRDWYYNLPTTAKREALASALSLKHAEKNVLVVEDFVCKAVKTQPMVAQLKKWGLENALVVLEQDDENLLKSLRNVKHIVTTTAGRLNVLDLFRSKKVVFTEKAIGKLLERMQHGSV